MTIERNKVEKESTNRRVVNAFIRGEDDKFLVIVRSEDDPIFPGMYGLPGGHVEDGEDVESALAREIEEEIGFKITAAEAPSVFESKLSIHGHKMQISVHRAFSDEGKENLQVSEVQEIEWITTEDFIADLREHDYPENEIDRFERFLEKEFSNNEEIN